MPSDLQSQSLLHPEHDRMLTAASGIAPDLVSDRGYRTVTARAELRHLGFTDQQCNVPALLIPLFGVTGEPVGYQSRPDQPRMNLGKAVKYETATGQRMALDVHPRVRHLLADPTVPLFVTEGVKKGDALASQHLCGVALLGVWSWRGANEHGGTTALPDWEQIALKGRRVPIVFDSDVMVKEAVYKALARLGPFLTSRGAEVLYIYLPTGEHGAKVGVDDYLAAGHSVDDLLALASTELRHPVTDDAAGENAGPYEETESGLNWLRPSKDGPVRTPLANFTCRIIAEIAEDDGAEIRRKFELEAWRRGRPYRFSIPAAQFVGMGWVQEHLGASAILYPGVSVKEHARTAIQVLSGEIAERHIYAHLGWQKAGDHWVYLHGGGAIGPHGLHPGIEVALPDALAGYRLPDPPNGPELKAAVQASLRILDVAPDRVTVPVAAGIWRAPFGSADCSVHVAGQTGAGKTELAALVQQHFGAGLDARHLPGNWESTANALEGLAFLAKDALLTIDDFAPGGGVNDIQRQHRDADRVFRSQGNHAGRQRMQADATLRAPRPPRGMLLSTGEEAPQGHSLRARVVVVDVRRGDVRWDRLTDCQRDASAGLYAQAMSAYLQWLAPRYDEARRLLGAEVASLRSEAAQQGGHKRDPANIAQLGVGLRWFLAFAVDREILRQEEAGGLWRRCWSALTQAGDAQAEHQNASEPTLRFRQLLGAALASGAAHVANGEGSDPEMPQAWGWRRTMVGAGEYQRSEWRAQGARVGWLDGEDLYLEADATYSVVQRLGHGTGEGITLTLATLKKRLHEMGLLASTEHRAGDRLRLEVRRTLEGQRRAVLHVHAASFLSENVDQVDQVDQAPDPPDPDEAAADPAAARGGRGMGNNGGAAGPGDRSESDADRGAAGPHGPQTGRGEDAPSGCGRRGAGGAAATLAAEDVLEV